ncbi:triple gene block protein 3 [Musa ornata-associated banmivirus]|uniref:triple gene block protein 3 n=1 Tax=Musa ornata-associated banmivirus TaxID=3071210 RepID=UPI002481EB1B|nr:triple gene block protein 3 [Musa ornata-associated banmivirus]UIK24038.1 triple gene block protein 3 [Musa ornata-associated banmivirus]
MALTKPSDYTKVYLVGAAAVGTAFLIHSLRRNELPHVGDNLHHLPHGGTYRDGTKSINYCGKSNQTLNLPSYWPLVLIFTLIFAIHVTSRKFQSSVNVHHCHRSCYIHHRQV